MTASQPEPGPARTRRLQLGRMGIDLRLGIYQMSSSRLSDVKKYESPHPEGATTHKQQLDIARRGTLVILILPGEH